jgi:hypothetical protein
MPLLSIPVVRGYVVTGGLGSSDPTKYSAVIAGEEGGEAFVSFSVK